MLPDTLTNPTLESAIAEFLQAEESGIPQSHQQWLDRYPELADELQIFFHSRENVPRLWSTRGAGLWPANAESILPTPSRLGDYELLEPIARGGMGIVYKARHTRLNRIVALKLIVSGQLARRSDVERFHGEAEAAAGLDHPNIVPIYEIGQHAGQHYFTMKLIPGGSLADSLARNPKSQIPNQNPAARLLATVSRAVHYAHQCGILHRDLKPSNILLEWPPSSRHNPCAVTDSSANAERHASSPQSAIRNPQCSDFGPWTLDLGHCTPYITDFGLAKRFETDGSLTHSGAIVGTPLYMAPEQAAGHKNLTTAADIYSLGAILYWLLTGKPAFEAATPLETLRQLQEQEPTSPRLLNPAIDRDLETICLKCLEKDPARRYPSAAALADDLDHWLAGEPITARPLTRAERIYRWTKRQPAIAALSLALLFIAALGLFGILSQWQLALASEQKAVANEQMALANEQKAETQAAVAVEKAQEAATQRDEAQKQRDEVKSLNEKLLATQEHLKRMLYASDLSHAKLALDSGARTRARELLNKHRAKTGERDERGFEWHYLQRLNRAVLMTIQGRSLGNVVFSPDGKQVASAAQVWDTPGAPKHVVRMWDAQTGRTALTLSEQPAAGLPSICVAFSPDGARLATGSSDREKRSAPGQIQIYNARTAEVLSTIITTSGVNAIAFSPDGGQLAAALHDKAAKMWDVQMGQEALSIQHTSNVTCLAFSPDGQRLVTGTGSAEKDAPCQVTAWDAHTGERQMSLQSHGLWDINSVAFSSDGKRLASSAWDGMIRIWDAQSGHELRVMNGQGTNALTFSPDGRNLAGTSNRGAMKTWDVETGIETVTFRNEFAAGGTTGIAYSPDGKRLVSGGPGILTIWDADISESRLIRGGHVGGAIAYSPDGRCIATSGGDTAVIWDAVSHKEILSLKHPEVRAGDPSWGEVYGLSYSPDGKFLATAGWLGWDDKNNKNLGYLLKAWDAQSGRLIHDFSDKVESAGELAFTPDGKRLIVPNGNLISTWDLDSGARQLDFKGHDKPVNRLAISPDGTRILSTAMNATKKAILWNAQTGDEVFALDLYRFAGRPMAVAFAPDNTRFALAASNNILVFNAQTGAQLLELSAHTAPLTQIAFSPDGTRLVTASSNGTMSIWDANDGQELLTLAPFESGRPTIAFSPDGQHLAVSIYGALKILDASPLSPPSGPPPSRQMRGQPLAEGWETTGAALREGIEVGLDSTTKHGGQNSAFVKSKVGVGQIGGGANQRFRADDYRGKRVRFTGFIKSENVDARAFLWMRADGETQAGPINNMQNRPIRGTSDWQRYEIVLDIPDDAVSIMIGFALGGGPGQIWADDFQIDVVGPDVPTTEPATAVGRYLFNEKNTPPEQTKPLNLDFEK